jgi:hypothetical protein
LKDAAYFFLADFIENFWFKIDPFVLGDEPYYLFEELFVKDQRFEVFECFL